MYLFKDIFHGYGLLQAAPFHRSDAAICENSQRRRRVLLGLRRTQGGQLHRKNHQARLPEGEREGALARKDQRPGGESRRQGRVPEEDQRRHEREERPGDDQAARNPSQSVIRAIHYSVTKGNWKMRFLRET